MDTVTLKASKRVNSGKGVSRRLRAAGQIPAVAYGRGKDTDNLSITHDDLRDILLSERGRNTLINLDIEGAAYVVMVKEYTVHPLSRNLLHADFVRIDEKTPVEVKVPFRTTGRSKGETIGGTLLVSTRVLKLRCLPNVIPTAIEYDVSEMDINDVVKVAELTLPEGVEALMASDRKVVSVAPPRVEAAPEGEEGEEGEGGEEGASEEAAPAAEG